MFLCNETNRYIANKIVTETAVSFDRASHFCTTPNLSVYTPTFGFVFGSSSLVDALPRLVAVGQATHAAHDAQHVVVDGIDAHLRRASGAHRVHGHRELQRGLVDTREVARAGRLVLLRLEGEGVDADTRGRRHAAVVLERLHECKITSLALREAILSVELQLGKIGRASCRERVSSPV